MAHLLIWFVFIEDLDPTSIFRAWERYIFIFLALRRLSRPINHDLRGSMFEHPIHDFSIFRVPSLPSWERSRFLFLIALLILVRGGNPIGCLFTETAPATYPSGISLGSQLNRGRHNHTTSKGILNSFPWSLFLLLTCVSRRFIGFNFERLVVEGGCGTWLLRVRVRGGQEDSGIEWGCLILGRTCHLSGGLGRGSDLLWFVSCILWGVL